MTALSNAAVPLGLLALGFTLGKLNRDAILHQMEYDIRHSQGGKVDWVRISNRGPRY